MSKSKTKSKRANGEGTFYQLSDNTWVHQITLGRKPDGSLDRKCFTGKTRTVCIERRDAYIEQKQREFIQQQEEEANREAKRVEMEKRGHSLESEILFSEAFLHWLKLFKAPPTKNATTYSGYLNTYEVHFDEAFGSMHLYEITRDIVQEYYNQKQLEGSRKDGKAGALSAKTIRNHHMILRDFFDYAVDKYKLPVNPALKTERPEVIRPQMRVLDPDEMSVFLHEVMRETQRTAILFALFMGLRVGELLAAEVSDIDINPHALRHTFATRLVEENVPITTVQELMGHASVSTTQRYVTTMPHEMRKAVESVAVYCDPQKLLEVKKLNGTKDRMKYSDVRLPSWLQTEPARA